MQISIDQGAMSEKLCLQWDDFKTNVYSAFGRLRDDREFTDVTLACEDGQQLEAHKVILAASSPFFEKILQRHKHPHPLIYLRGFKSEDLMAILDFLYFGEANVYQEDLDSFLVIARELKLKGLTGQTTSNLVKHQEKGANSKPVHKTKEEKETPTTYTYTNVQIIEDAEEASNVTEISNQFTGDLPALGQKVKKMMGRSQKMIQKGKRASGIPKHIKAFICKVCGKEGHAKDIRNHIEANHLEGISIPCDYCFKTFCSRDSLRKHKSEICTAFAQI